MKEKITQQKVADYLGINNGDLSSIIHGNLNLSIKNAWKIKRKTGWTIDHIYDVGVAEVVKYVKYKLSNGG